MTAAGPQAADPAAAQLGASGVRRLGFTGLALPLAWLAQQHRWPLVAVVLLVIGLAPFVPGLTRRGKVALALRGAGDSPWYVGEPVRLRTVLLYEGPRPLTLVTIVQSCPGLELAPLALPGLHHGEVATVPQDVTPLHRRGPGEYEARILLRHWATGVAVRSLTVRQPMPAIRPRPLLPPQGLLRLAARPADDGGSRSGRIGHAEPLALRGFAAGDVTSAVHWRATARAGRPMVLDREQPAVAIVVLLVASAGSGPAWEAAVARASGVVAAAAVDGVPIEVVCPVPWSLPAPEAGYEGLQDWLAGVTDVGLADDTLLQHAVRRCGGGLLVVLSGTPQLAAAAVSRGVPASRVVDLVADPW